MAGVTGGRPDMIETVAKAGIAVGVDGIFMRLILTLQMLKAMVLIAPRLL
jgi:3-deoxy-D-manno-octulosonic acid (KDO) 8-phosphate synthase